MFKRIGSVLLSLALLVSGCAMAEETPATQGFDHLTVGSTTRMKGEFFTEAWGNATSDYDVKDLLHGYNLIRWDAENGMFTADESVVSGITVGENAQGDRSYIMILQNDLFYSDGTKITAWDYAFSFLLRICPELEALGGRTTESRYIFGSEEYLSGAAGYLAGIRVTADDTLTVTVRHEYLPFFYELGLLRCNPYPIHVIAPGVAIRDDGNGVYLTNQDPEIAEPLFTAELLAETLSDPETGYRSHPSVVSGPYTLTSWDGTTATFDINPYFKGDWEGKKPLIQHLTYTLATNETMIADLREGKFGLLNKVTNAEAIQQGMGEVGQGGIQMSAYPRIGLSYISFCCEKPTVASKAVRQAIAWCLDRDEIVQDYTGNFGLRTDGYYGIGQWVYSVLNGTVAPPVKEPEDENDREAKAAYEAEKAEWEALTADAFGDLTVYTADLEQARKLLDGDGWTLNADGIREKETDGETVRLELTMICPAGNKMAEYLQEKLVPNLEEVGIRLTIETAEMQDLLAMFYRQAPRDNDLFFLASNFDLVFDPSAGISLENGTPTWSSTAWADEEMYELAAEMRQTPPGNVLEYCRKWLRFQQWFNETLPMLPLYSNAYFDFYTENLHDYPISESVSWGQAIVGASLYEETEAADGMEEME